MSPVFWIGGVLCAGWMLLGIFIHLSFIPQHLPTFLFYAAVSIRTGLLFLTVENVGGVGRRLTGWGFILWGLHRANYPFLRTMEWLAPWRFLVAALLALIVAIGMLLVYFERILATLSASERRFRTLVEHSTDGMFLLDLDGRILDTNRHACQSLGYSREQLLELNLQEVVRGLTQIVLPSGPNRLAPGVPSTLDGLHRRRDGTTFPVELRLSTIENSQQQMQLLALARDVSRQKAAEEQLRQSSRKFEALFQQAFQLLAVLSPDGILLEVNQAALSLIGEAASAVLNRPFVETPWWDRDSAQKERVRQAIRQAAGGNVVRMELTLNSSDGAEHLVDASLTPIFDDAGGISLLIAEGRDITERLHFERRLKTINLKLEALIDASPMPIVAVDRDLMITEWNRAAEQTFGWRRDEVIGVPYPMVPESEVARERLLIQKVLSGEKIQGVELLRRRKDGSTIHLELYAAPLHDAEGVLDGAMGLFIDRREQKAAEERLRASENRYRTLYQQFETLFNGIPDPITLVDRDMKIVWANQGAAYAFDQEQAGVSGQHCYRFWHGKDTVCPDCPVVECFASGEFQERKISTPDGRVWGVKVFPIRDKDGQIVNALELVTNITEKIRLREQTERTSRLASLGELAAGVAHEINNPNGLILLNLPVLVEAMADMLPILDAHARDQGDFSFGGLPFSRMRHELPEMLDEIKDGAMRIKRIVDDLKNFVRQDLPRSEEIDLNQAVQAAVRLTATEIRRATDRFSVAYAEPLPPVGGSTQRLEQVLVNLIVNACQALPDKNRSLAVVTRFDATAGMIVVEVRDEGTGIAEANLKRLTEPFFTTRRERGGTGLGLAVSSRIVKEHGGELRFSSTPGQGTTATVLLPPYKRG